LFTVITDVWRDSRFRNQYSVFSGQYPVISGKWEAIDIMGATAARLNPTISPTSNF
jgi:hypothetical protein